MKPYHDEKGQYVKLKDRVHKGVWIYHDENGWSCDLVPFGSPDRKEDLLKRIRKSF